MTYKIDLHVHTAASLDGLSSLEELTAAAKAAGLDAIAVTDHNLCTPVPQQLNGVLLIPGCEVSTRQGHITALFLEEPLDLTALRKDGLPQGGDAVGEIHRRGGIAVLAHPCQSPNAAPEQFAFRPDCVEGANARAALKVKDANEKAAALADDIMNNCEESLASVMYTGGTGGSARGGVCTKPLAITKAVHEGKAVLTIGGAPAYILPGGGINFIVDAGKVVNHGFTWVPTPATVAPVEYTMTKADYEAIGGHMDCIRPVEELRRELGV